MDTASSNSTMQAILAFLKKNNLTSTEEQLKAELAKMQKKQLSEKKHSLL